LQLAGAAFGRRFVWSYQLGDFRSCAGFWTSLKDSLKSLLRLKPGICRAATRLMSAVALN